MIFPDDTQAKCAHKKVVHAPIQNPDGTMSDRWQCDMCEQQFAPLTFFKMQIEEWQQKVRDAGMALDAAGKEIEASRNLGVHLSHCNFGENANRCKYGLESCPALSESWSWFGRNMQEYERMRNQEAHRLGWQRSPGKKAVVPDAMLEVARRAVFEYIQMLSSLGAIDDNHLAKVALEAALGWLTENVPVPTDEDCLKFGQTWRGASAGTPFWRHVAIRPNPSIVQHCYEEFMTQPDKPQSITLEEAEVVRVRWINAVRQGADSNNAVQSAINSLLEEKAKAQSESWVGGNRDVDPNNADDVKAWQERDRQAAEQLKPAPEDSNPVMFSTGMPVRLDPFDCKIKFEPADVQDLRNATSVEIKREVTFDEARKIAARYPGMELPTEVKLASLRVKLAEREQELDLIESVMVKVAIEKMPIFWRIHHNLAAQIIDLKIEIKYEETKNADK